MALSRQRLTNVLKVLQITAIGVMALALVATAVLIWLESTWASPVFREPDKAFRHGSIGTEVMPLPVAHVLPELFPEHFQPAGPNNGDWVEQFGFIPSDDPESDGLPVGFALSNYRPQSAAPSPVTFVGFSCGLCHASRVEVEETRMSKLILGSSVATPRCVLPRPQLRPGGGGLTIAGCGGRATLLSLRRDGNDEDPELSAGQQLQFVFTESLRYANESAQGIFSVKFPATRVSLSSARQM